MQPLIPWLPGETDGRRDERVSAGTNCRKDKEVRETLRSALINRRRSGVSADSGWKIRYVCVVLGKSKILKKARSQERNK